MAFLSRPNLQNLRAIHTTESAFAYVKAFAAHQEVYATSTKTQTLTCNFTHGINHGRTVRFATGHVLTCRARTINETTRGPFAHAEFAECPHGFFALRGLQEFFVASSFIASFSSVRLLITRRIR